MSWSPLQFSVEVKAQTLELDRLGFSSQFHSWLCDPGNLLHSSGPWFPHLTNGETLVWALMD